MKIAIIYSVPTRRAITTPFLAADEDTKASAEKVAQALKTKGQDVILMPVTENAIRKIASISADVIVNLIEWSGLDFPLNLRAVRMLTKTGIPFTGANVFNVQVTNDKAQMKRALDRAGLPTSRWQIFTTGGEAIRNDFSYPVIAKLALEHCSIGLSHDAVVADSISLHRLVKDRIKTFGQPIVAEEFITGREFQVTILDREEGIDVLPPAEIFFVSGIQGFLTYAGRWDEAHADFHTSSIALAKLTSDLWKDIQVIARDSFRRLKFCDYSRLDIRVRDEEMFNSRERKRYQSARSVLKANQKPESVSSRIFILEANSNPGLDDDDDYGMTISYKAIGMNFADFVWEIITSCLRRFTKRPPG